MQKLKLIMSPFRFFYMILDLIKTTPTPTPFILEISISGLESGQQCVLERGRGRARREREREGGRERERGWKGEGERRGKRVGNFSPTSQN